MCGQGPPNPVDISATGPRTRCGVRCGACWSFDTQNLIVTVDGKKILSKIYMHHINKK